MSCKPTSLCKEREAINTLKESLNIENLLA